MPPLPKPAVVPMFPTGAPDSIVNLVVRRDIDLSGQFNLLPESASPPGPFAHDANDLASWREKGAEYLIRVYAQPAGGDASKTDLVGEAYLTSKSSGRPSTVAPVASTSGDGTASAAPAEDARNLSFARRSVRLRGACGPPRTSSSTSYSERSRGSRGLCESDGVRGDHWAMAARLPH